MTQIDAKNRQDGVSGVAYASDDERKAFVTAYLHELEKQGKRGVTDTVDKWMIDLEYGAMMSALFYAGTVLTVADPALIFQQHLIPALYQMYKTYTDIKKKHF